MKENIFLYFTSDLHSHFENWPKIANYLEKKSAIHKQEGDQYYLIDNGDHLDRVHPITEAYLGKVNIDFLNEAKYDVVTVGNNEGITLPPDNLYELYDKANFEVVCGNIGTKDKVAPSWLKPYTIITTRSGIKIGVIGLTAPFHLFYEQLGWKAESPYTILDQLLPELKEKSDIVLLLSHLGINDDEYISNHYAGIDVIIGGHTHHLFKEGNVINNTLLTAVGKYGFHVGKIQLTWDHHLKRLIRKVAVADELADDSDHLHTVKLLDDYNDKATELLNEPVGTLKKDYEVDSFEETVLMKTLVQTLQTWTKADCAMLNAGILLDGLKAGVVSKGDLHRICPHPINPCKVRISGELILEAIRMGLSKRFTEFELKGFGFRGKQIGKMIFSNIDVHVHYGEDNHVFVKEVWINGKPVDEDKEYEVATADMFTFGKLLPGIAASKEKEYFMPEFIRDVLSETVKKLSKLG
ncbi:2',3'-cyclic-nucleotide 2'-phosphodiesterase (5'-nucleotidase family) [Salirhabdus euzebyi]|uniref:2',3'-cyclic-nucleotide 2'-phosphodiesterase (5'-nucleotidase family) n=1 Tax=Salirhabdus euzebyi TaxID=394506 RepID=A0A841Q4Y7_9BACI|nr:bifunctional UDP-sugar hydrolase/5'-nucleotidase [Salirhabdus euzebyi]MBB6453455.1 2',3'-cyclic-nucleotide 2'-phosphodiesterase (5'-nucleotidase family) [Salirhabdus euzebyi]